MGRSLLGEWGQVPPRAPAQVEAREVVRRLEVLLLVPRVVGVHSPDPVEGVAVGDQRHALQRPVAGQGLDARQVGEVEAEQLADEVVPAVLVGSADVAAVHVQPAVVRHGAEARDGAGQDTARVRLSGEGGQEE